jgi:CheY-like chemotaxis protein
MPVVQFLRDCGDRVIEAANTGEAIAVLQKTDVPVDVVLSAIDIPGSMNGFKFAVWARSLRPELKIALAAPYLIIGVTRPFDQSLCFSLYLRNPGTVSQPTAP